jgi:predicted Zn-dependent protease
LSLERAQQIVNEMKTTVANWEQYFLSQEVSQLEIEAISPCFSAIVIE